MLAKHVQSPVDKDVLPSSSSPDLIIVPATPAETEQTSLLNANEWRGPLSLPQYLERERHLTKQDLTKDNKITAWILTSTQLPSHSDGTRPILAACETILKSAYVVRNGKVECVHTHGIGSVYTRAEHRGKGYAGRMMQELAKQLETYQQLNGDKSTFTILFSDIGEKFYARYGWTPFASTHIHLSPLDAEQFKSAMEKFPTVHDIDRTAMSRIPATTYLEESLKTLSRQTPEVPCVAIRPDMQHFDWHHAREEVQSRLLGLPNPQIKGAIHEPTGIAIIWNRVYSSNSQEWSLHILHVVIPPALRENPDEEVRKVLSSLLLRAQYEAYAWNMVAGVEIWDPSELLISAAQSLRSEEQGEVKVIRRDQEHICSLRWMDGRAVNDVTKMVNWVNLEKYTWC